MSLQEEDMLTCHENSHSLWVTLLTGIYCKFQFLLLFFAHTWCYFFSCWFILTPYTCVTIEFCILRYEGLVFSVGGNGRSYVVILEAGPSADTTQSKLYFSRISTKAGFCRVSLDYNVKKIIDLVMPPFWILLDTLYFYLMSLHMHLFSQLRVPFSSFRPVKPDDPPLDPFLVHTLTIRFEPRRQVFPRPKHCLPHCCHLTSLKLLHYFFYCYTWLTIFFGTPKVDLYINQLLIHLRPVHII